MPAGDLIAAPEDPDVVARPLAVDAREIELEGRGQIGREIDRRLGPPARLARYSSNCAALIDGMAKLGFRPFLASAVPAPIIVTFHAPADPTYHFKTFYEMTRDRGYILYPGTLTQVDTVRVGCIGAIDANEMRNVASAVEQTLRAMGIKQVAPVTQRKAA